MKDTRANLDKKPGIGSEIAAKNGVALVTGGIGDDVGPGEETRKRPSFAQQRLWFWDQLNPGRPVYNIPTATRLLGPLDVASFGRAVREIFVRHDSLRSAFRADDGRPWLEIDAAPPIDVPVIDLSALPEPERESEWLRLWESEFRHAFDLTKAPLVRWQLIRLRPGEHVFLWNAHHIIYDMWSHAVFLGELAELYATFNSGNTAPVSKLLSYADYAERECSELTPKRTEADLKYWCDQLSGGLVRLNLPRDLPPDAGNEFDGGSESMELPCELADSLRRTARQEGVTVYTLLLSAFAMLLHRYTGQNDFVIGAPITTRDRVETENAIGLFLNTLVIRIRISAGLSFRQLLKQVRATMFDAYDHRALPFDRLVEALQPERRTQGESLFQVMFDYQPVVPREHEGGELRFVPLETRTRTSKFELTLLMKERASGLTADLEYNSSLFHRKTASRMLRQLRVLLEGIASEPDRSLNEIPMLAQEERQQVVVEWNRTESDYPRESTVADLFEHEAALNPDAIALVYEHRAGCRCGCGERGFGGRAPLIESVSYRDLNARANRLAHRLQSLGVGPEVTVGLCSERCVEMVVGLLAIVKAGGAYVPLDAAYPRERLSYMIADSGVRFVLAPPHLADSIGAAGGEVIRWDHAFKDYSAVNPSRTGGGDELAYVIYTSGSTGQPKGVLVPHRGVLRLVKGANYFEPRADDVFLHMAPLTFDASTFELWAPLLNGRCVVIMPPNPVSLEEMGRVIERFRVTVLWLTSGLFHVMADERPQDLRRLRRIFTGGDVVSIPHVERFVCEVGGVELINCYGPTENTTFTTWYVIPRGGPVRSHSIPIGRPISNTRVYILDETMRPAPIGVPGELWIGGDGLAREYLNAPELTQARFIEPPAELREGGRLYRTGDIARWLDDGNIEFIGRRDHQVKVRGHRIELGEIESALMRHGGVREAAVIVRGEWADSKELIAYWTSRREPAPATEELRRHLSDCLPEYMAPSAFVRLDSFPLTENGKVDRHRLAQVETVAAETGSEFEAPRNDVEIRLAELWREVLGVDRAGVHDDFFAVGGHSLLATRLAARISSAFGVDFPLRALFEARTIARMSQLIPEMTEGKSGLQPIVRRGHGLEQAAGDLENMSEEEVDKLLRELSEGSVHG